MTPVMPPLHRGRGDPVGVSMDAILVPPLLMAETPRPKPTQGGKSYLLRVQITGHPWEKPGQELEQWPWRDGGYGMVALHSYVSQDYLLRDSTPHSGLASYTSIINQEKVPIWSGLLASLLIKALSQLKLPLPK